MYEIRICPLKKLYLISEDGDMSDVAVIAVSSYDIRSDKISVFGKRFCMSFADTADQKHASAFHADIANEMAAFISSLPQTLDTLFVCCDSGESRSAAMAAAIMRYNGLDEQKVWQNPHYHPNPLVYSLLCEALGVPVSQAELQAKIRMSEKALSDAINRSQHA